MKLLCNKCGKENKNNTNSCIYCNSHLKNLIEAQNNSDNDSNNKKKSKKKKIIIGIIIAIVVVIIVDIIIWGIIFLNKILDIIKETSSTMDNQVNIISNITNNSTLSEIYNR